jgi:hypothetical protein
MRALGDRRKVRRRRRAWDGVLACAAMTFRKPLRVPSKLSYSIVAAFAAACSSSSGTENPTSDASTESGAPIDAAVDASADVSADSPTTDAMADADSCAATLYCGPAEAGASCPGFICDLSQCPPGCEPMV